LTPVPSEFVAAALPGGQPSARLQRQGIQARQSIYTTTTYAWFNMEDPVVGGYTADRVALRRALALAYDIDVEIAAVRRGQGVVAQGPIGPGLAGYDPQFRSDTTRHSFARAKALLDLYGWVDRDGDGWRERPDGGPLSIEFAVSATAFGRAIAEVWQRTGDRIGVRLKFRFMPVGELLKSARSGALQASILSWGATMPDGEGLLQLLYGPNKGKTNSARFALPEFDRLYEQAQVMPDSPERTELYRRMSKLVLAYAPWRAGVHPVATSMWQPWLSGFRSGGQVNSYLHFLDIDATRRQAANR
jgi:ABC-type transport system substrate-binding protein